MPLKKTNIDKTLYPSQWISPSSLLSGASTDMPVSTNQRWKPEGPPRHLLKCRNSFTVMSKGKSNSSPGDTNQYQLNFPNPCFGALWVTSVDILKTKGTPASLGSLWRHYRRKPFLNWFPLCGIFYSLKIFFNFILISSCEVYQHLMLCFYIECQYPLLP